MLCNDRLKCLKVRTLKRCNLTTLKQHCAIFIFSILFVLLLYYYIYKALILLSIFMAKKRIFNLLKPEIPPLTVWDKIYDWLIQRARIVIVFTEILVVIAFMSKIVVDTQAKNKEKKIEQLNNEVRFFALEKEPKFREIQAKDSDYRLLWNQMNKYSEILTEVYSYLGNTSSDLNVSVSADKVSVSGSIDLESLKRIEASMESSPTFSSAYIDNLIVESEDVDTNTGKYVLVAIINKENRLREQI